MTSTERDRQLAERIVNECFATGCSFNVGLCAELLAESRTAEPVTGQTFEEWWAEQDCGDVHFKAIAKLAFNAALATQDARIEAAMKLAEEIRRGPMNRDCCYCHKTDRYQVIKIGVQIEHHKDDCPVRLADELLRALGRKPNES
jgi:hypothetical protein